MTPENKLTTSHLQGWKVGQCATREEKRSRKNEVAGPKQK